LALTLDEAMTWGGDKKHEGRMKDLITGTTMDINPKFIPVYTVANRMRIFIHSNNEWVVPASRDERRYLVIYVSSAQQQNHEYFAADIDLPITELC
jgi:hypothetical protein